MHHYCGKVEPLKTKAKHYFSEHEGSISASSSLRCSHHNGIKSDLLACDSLNIFFLVRRATSSFALLSKPWHPRLHRLSATPSEWLYLRHLCGNAFLCSPRPKSFSWNTFQGKTKALPISQPAAAPTTQRAPYGLSLSGWSVAEFTFLTGFQMRFLNFPGNVVLLLWTDCLFVSLVINLLLYSFSFW